MATMAVHAETHGALFKAQGVTEGVAQHKRLHVGGMGSSVVQGEKAAERRSKEVDLSVPVP
jgi:hypothetical protein